MSSVYNELAEIPVPTSARFTNTTNTSGFSAVRISYSVRDHDRNVKRSVTKTFTFDENPQSAVIPSATSHDPSDVVASISAPSEKRHAILREVTDANGAKKRYVEVWLGIQLDASLDVTKHHGQFHTDDYFRSSSFAPSETAFVYTAEALSSAETADEYNGPSPFSKFRFVPHCGEQLRTRKRPTLFVFRWQNPSHDQGNSATPVMQSVTALSLDQPPHLPVILFGQATFVSETRLYATGYEQTNDGRLLGIKWCFNRPSSIWELVLQAGRTPGSAGTITMCRAVRIEAPGRSCRSPRVVFDADGVPTTLFWLSNPIGGAHASTVSLHARDLKGTAGDRILVDVVHDPRSPGEFPGLYTEYNLADSPFVRSGDKTHIVVESLWHSRQTLVSIDVESGAVNDLTPIEPSDHPVLHSWNLLGTDGARSVVCSRSTPTTPPETVLLTWEDEQSPLALKVLDRPHISPKLQEAMNRLEARVIPIQDRYPVETIVISSKDPESAQAIKPVCLTILHGGPHGSSVTSFTPTVLAYALKGYTVSMPNYTGSTGFGERYIQELIGKCGSLDVADCLAAVNELVRLGLSEQTRQIVQGGSHGGFLAAHLIGQHPDVFRAAVLRNPVISAGELLGTSDIPDWALCEFGLDATPVGDVEEVRATPDRFAALYAASPIAHVHRVKARVLLLIGEDDLRVPPMQGMGYYHALKARAGAVEMLVFPKETHPIDGVEAARASFEAGLEWFARAWEEI